MLISVIATQEAMSRLPKRSQARIWDACDKTKLAPPYATLFTIPDYCLYYGAPFRIKTYTNKMAETQYIWQREAVAYQDQARRLDQWVIKQFGNI